jgi:alcohol dehydrogenase YqhD (iron-dependent ADH family)
VSRVATVPPTAIVSPTTVHAGHRTADAALDSARPGAVAVLYDPAVEHLIETIARAHPHHRLVCRRVDRAPTMSDLESVGPWLQAVAPTELMALGGGRVLDLAKLAATLGDSPASVRHLGNLARRAGYARLPGDLTDGLPLLAVPTTLGTGAEVSPVAVIDDAAGDRTLVFSPHLRPTTAVLDPRATATLPIRLVREGALEAMLRVAGPEIGSPSTLRMAATEALLLTQQLAGALDECADDEEPSDELRLFVAQLSNATHRGWALTGRSAYPSPLWFLGAELSVVLGVTKMAATAMLLPTWLARVADGDGRWGDRSRLDAVWRAMSGQPPDARVAEATRALLGRWRLEPATIDAAPDAAARTTQRAVRRWGGRLPMLGRFGPGDISALLREALATAPVAPAAVEA